MSGKNKITLTLSKKNLLTMTQIFSSLKGPSLKKKQLKSIKKSNKNRIQKIFERLEKLTKQVITEKISNETMYEDSVLDSFLPQEKMEATSILPIPLSETWVSRRRPDLIGE